MEAQVAHANSDDPGGPMEAQVPPWKSRWPCASSDDPCKPNWDFCKPHGSPDGPGDHCVPSLQVSGSRLRLLQVTAADSGEYVCRVTSGGTTKETAVMVTIQPSGASAYREWGQRVTVSVGGDHMLQHRAMSLVPVPAGLCPGHQCHPLVSVPSAGQHDPAAHRVPVLRRGRGPDPGPQLRHHQPHAGHRHLVQAWGVPPGQAPGRGR